MSDFLRIEYERRRRKWSQRALALISGVDQAYISLIETGKYNPSSAQLEQIAQAFCISPPSVLLKPVSVPREPEEQEQSTDSTEAVRA